MWESYYRATSMVCPNTIDEHALSDLLEQVTGSSADTLLVQLQGEEADRMFATKRKHDPATTWEEDYKVQKLVGLDSLIRQFDRSPFNVLCDAIIRHRMDRMGLTSVYDCGVQARLYVQHCEKMRGGITTDSQIANIDELKEAVLENSRRSEECLYLCQYRTDSGFNVHTFAVHVNPESNRYQETNRLRLVFSNRDQYDIAHSALFKFESHDDEDRFTSIKQEWNKIGLPYGDGGDGDSPPWSNDLPKHIEYFCKNINKCTYLDGGDVLQPDMIFTVRETTFQLLEVGGSMLPDL